MKLKCRTKLELGDQLNYSRLELAWFKNLSDVCCPDKMMLNVSRR